MNMDAEAYVEKFKPSLMDVVYTWCNGASFAQICKMTDVFEGIVFCFWFKVFMPPRNFPGSPFCEPLSTVGSGWGIRFFIQK